jgi:hypothetical protein
LLLGQFPEFDVLELGPHRFAGVELECQNTFAKCQVRIVVGKI